MSNFVLTPNAVAKLRRAIAPRSGNTGAVAASGVPIDPDKFPPPFTVRWSASANSGAGAWVIWLPDVAQLVMLKDEYITPTGVTADQALPAGWYTIDAAAASSTEVYLNITIPETGTASAEISTTQGQSMTGETVMSILVAEMETDAQTGAKRVKQYVDSAALVGSVKDGESGADAGIVITQEPVSPSTDHPGGGIEITFQPTQGGQPHGQPTVVTLWNGSGGGGGGTDLSDTPALDVVPSTGNASAGVAVTASRSDHVHKMPATVMLTDVDQTVSSHKTFAAQKEVRFAFGEGDNFRQGTTSTLYFIGYNSFQFFRANPTDRTIIVGSGVGYGFEKVLLGRDLTTTPDDIAAESLGRHFATLLWVNTYYQRKLTEGTNITINGTTISATVPEALKNPHPLRVYGNPTDANGTAIASPNPTPYDGSAQKDIRLDGLVTKGTSQTITGSKTFASAVVVEFQDGQAEIRNGGINLKHPSGSGYIRFLSSSGSVSTSIAETAAGVLVITSPNHARLSVAPVTNPNAAGYNALQIDTVGAANDRFQQKLSGTVEFVADIDWYVDGDTHQLRKRLRVLDLATGSVTDKAGTTYANGWEVAANTTPISSIIPQPAQT